MARVIGFGFVLSPSIILVLPLFNLRADGMISCDPVPHKRLNRKTCLVRFLWQCLLITLAAFLSRQISALFLQVEE